MRKAYLSRANCLARHREATRDNQLSCFLKCAVSFLENFASRGEVSNIKHDRYFSHENNRTRDETAELMASRGRVAQFLPPVCDRLKENVTLIN